MARFITLSFLLLPLAEIAMFIVVGRAIGLFPTLALVVLGALAGGVILRQQGLGVIARMRSSMGAGTVPGRDMFDTMLTGLGAILLMIPGFLSDIVALVLFVPAVRGWMFSSLAKRVTVVETTTSYRRYPDPVEQTPHNLSGPRTIDLDETDWDDKRP